MCDWALRNCKWTGQISLVSEGGHDTAAHTHKWNTTLDLKHHPNKPGGTTHWDASVSARPLCAWGEKTHAGVTDTTLMPPCPRPRPLMSHITSRKFIWFQTRHSPDCQTKPNQTSHWVQHLMLTCAAVVSMATADAGASVCAADLAWTYQDVWCGVCDSWEPINGAHCHLWYPLVQHLSVCKCLLLCFISSVFTVINAPSLTSVERDITSSSFQLY